MPGTECATRIVVEARTLYVCAGLKLLHSGQESVIAESVAASVLGPLASGNAGTNIMRISLGPRLAARQTSLILPVHGSRCFSQVLCYRYRTPSTMLLRPAQVRGSPQPRAKISYPTV